MLKLRQAKTGNDDYGYLNARVRAMSSALFKNEDYQKLLELDNIKDIFSFLQDSGYGSDLDEAEKKYGAVMPQIEVYERGLEKNFHRILNKLRLMLDGEARTLFDLLLGKWDVQNIKVILRGKHYRLTPPLIIKDLTFSGNLTRETLELLAQAENVNAVIDQLIEWGVKYVNPLKEVCKQPVGGRRLLQDMERVLDKSYYAELLKRSKKKRRNFKIVHELVTEEIDKLNIMTALRLVKAQVPLEEGKDYFIPGGHKVQVKQYLRLLESETLEDAFDYLKKLTYQTVLETRCKLYEKIKDVSVFERSLEEHLAKRLYRVYRQDMLGFGVIMGYLRFKFDELLNLRIIGRAKEFGMPDDITRGEIILVR